MKKGYLLALDAGTGSFRAVLFDTKGKQLHISQEEWTHLSEDGIDGSMGFDCIKNYEIIKKCINDITKKVNPDDILALSATSFREGIVVYDKDKKELWAVANVDARASKEVKHLKNEYQGLEERFYEISGQTFALGALPRLLWLKNNKPDIYKKVAFFSMISDWILYKLGGIIASDPSNAGTSGIFSLKKRKYSKKMAKIVGIKSDIFPKILESGEVLGNVTKKASKECGLSQKTKVVMGGGDVQLGSAGLGVVDEGDVAVLGGSFWQQVVNIPLSMKPSKDMSIRINPHVIKDQSQAEGITFFSGLIMRWFRDAFCDREKEIALKKGKDVYDILQEEAKKVPAGSYGILPVFSDEMKYGKWYHASPSLINLSIDPETCNKYSIFRALMENAAIVSKLNLAKVRKFSKIQPKSIIFAGGASKGELWSQILSDVLGVEVKVPKVKEATALGAAMSAGIGVGIYKDFKDASKKLVKIEKIYQPNKKNEKIYKEIAMRWKKVYKVQLKLVDKNLTDSLWKAPGI